MGSITFKEIHFEERDVEIYLDGQTPPCLKIAPRQSTGSRFDKGVVNSKCPLKGRQCFPDRFGKGHIEPGKYSSITLAAFFSSAICGLSRVKARISVSEITPGTVINF